jgi:hypothetical protein
VTSRADKAKAERQKALLVKRVLRRKVADQKLLARLAKTKETK